MHQRSWLSLISLPLVALYTWPVVLQNVSSAKASRGVQQEVKGAGQDPLSGLADIQDVLGIVRDNYVDRPDMEKVVGGGIMATLERAHPLNAFLTPEDLRLPDPGPAGLGMKVVKRGIYAQVVAVRPGSPAAEAGILGGDVIRKIDGESVGLMSAWTLERRLRGPNGSDVELLRYAGATGNLAKVSLHRALPTRPAIEVRKDDKAYLVTLPDLGPGRADELKAALKDLDRARPLVLDLRLCMGGELEEAAKAAGCFASGPATLVTVQEAAAREGEVKDAPVSVVPSDLAAFPKAVVLTGLGTFGAPEALASALKKLGLQVYGERTYGLGVERARINLKQGGAVELVVKRWLGAGGEKLDRAGVEPTTALKGLKPTEDPLPKLLPLLETQPGKPADKPAGKAAFLLFPGLRPATAVEVA